MQDGTSLIHICDSLTCAALHRNEAFKAFAYNRVSMEG